MWLSNRKQRLVFQIILRRMLVLSALSARPTSGRNVRPRVTLQLLVLYSIGIHNVANYSSSTSRPANTAPVSTLFLEDLGFLLTMEEINDRTIPRYERVET